MNRGDTGCCRWWTETCSNTPLRLESSVEKVGGKNYRNLYYYSCPSGTSRQNIPLVPEMISHSAHCDNHNNVITFYRSHWRIMWVEYPQIPMSWMVRPKINLKLSLWDCASLESQSTGLPESYMWCLLYTILNWILLLITEGFEFQITQCGNLSLFSQVWNNPSLRS